MKRTISTSAASADARAAEPPTTDETINEEISNKIAKKDSNKKPQRFTKKPQGRRGGAAYIKTPTPTSFQIVPRLPVFPVHVSNIGCQHVTETVYTVIQGRDFRLAQNVTKHQLAYVTTLAFCNRVVQCAQHYGTAFPEGASRLKQVAAGIQLPSVLAKYIESIGSVEMMNGCTVVPYCAHFNLFFNNRYMMSPVHFLELAGRNVPDGPWALDIQWVTAYNGATTRASRSGMKFRSIDNSTFVGSPEMLVSYVPLVKDMLLPKAPQAMSEAEAQLGAAYRFRTYDDFAMWPGENRELLFDAFTAIPFDPQIVITDVCVVAFRGDYVSKD